MDNLTVSLFKNKKWAHFLYTVFVKLPVTGVEGCIAWSTYFPNGFFAICTPVWVWYKFIADANLVLHFIYHTWQLSVMMIMIMGNVWGKRAMNTNWIITHPFLFVMDRFWETHHRLIWASCTVAWGLVTKDRYEAKWNSSHSFQNLVYSRTDGQWLPLPYAFWVKEAREQRRTKL